MRLFFGLEPDAQTVADIALWRDTHLPCDGRPVSPANFHITLAFIGATKPGQLEQLLHKADNRLSSNPPPGDCLTLDTAGYFSRPGIFWLGPGNWPDSLTTMADRLRGLGEKKDRNAFRPHVTLYRGCQAPPHAPTQECNIAFSYRHVCLFESIQGKNGMRYEVLQEWLLA